MQISLGMLTDIVSYTLDLELPVKQKLLGELDVVRRAEILLGEARADHRREKKPHRRLHEFPPKFSSN